MTSSLVGSEMCIRDRFGSNQHLVKLDQLPRLGPNGDKEERDQVGHYVSSVSYTHLTLPTICSV
eukprot:8665388-Prorocentrum_lima.AAC.1